MNSKGGEVNSDPCGGWPWHTPVPKVWSTQLPELPATQLQLGNTDPTKTDLRGEGFLPRVLKRCPAATAHSPIHGWCLASEPTPADVVPPGPVQPHPDPCCAAHGLVGSATRDAKVAFLGFLISLAAPFRPIPCQSQSFRQPPS